MNRGVSTIEARISDEAGGWRLDRALAEALPEFSRERLKALISSGAVIDERGALAQDPARKAMAGSLFTVSVPVATPSHNEAQEIALNIVFEDDHLIVIDKPAGLVVHPAAGNLDGTLVNALLHHCAGRLSGIGGVARPGIVHRIDKDTSGLMVAAKTDRAHEGLAKQFAAHSIDRRYKAIVTGRPIPSEGIVDAPLARSPSNRKKIAIVSGRQARGHALPDARNASRKRRWSNAGSKPGARTRCASTWPRSDIPCLETRSMVEQNRSPVHFGNLEFPSPGIARSAPRVHSSRGKHRFGIR